MNQLLNIVLSAGRFLKLSEDHSNIFYVIVTMVSSSEINMRVYPNTYRNQSDIPPTKRNQYNSLKAKILEMEMISPEAKTEFRKAIEELLVHTSTNKVYRSLLGAIQIPFVALDIIYKPIFHSLSSKNKVQGFKRGLRKIWNDPATKFKSVTEEKKQALLNLLNKIPHNNTVTNFRNGTPYQPKNKPKNKPKNNNVRAN